MTIPVIVADAFFEDSDWGRESWAEMLELVRSRAALLLTVERTTARRLCAWTSRR